MSLSRILFSTAAAAFLAVGAASAADMKKVAISTIVEVPALIEVKNGILKGLEDKGFVVDENLEVDYQNANGNMPTQQQIAKKFAGDRPDVIVSITTPTSQAMAAAVKDIPIVFAAVTDPIKAKLIPQFEKPGGNITGASDAAPIGQQMDLIVEMLPELKAIGFIYNPGLDNAVADLEQVRKEAERLDIEVVESASPTTNEIVVAMRRLIGKVDAIYIPNDTTVVAVLETIVKICQEGQTPCFTGETGGVERGAAASVGFNYFEGGRVAGRMAGDVLAGKAVGEIDAVAMAEVLTDFVIHVNKGSADKMGLTIPEAVLSRAEIVIE